MAFLQNIFRKLVRNLLPGNSVEKILKVQICESGVMKNAIELWQDMYKNEPPWKGGQEKIIPLNLPAVISSEFARLILTEFRIEISGSQMAEYLDRQLKKDLIDLNKFVEWYCAGGGIAIKPYVAGVNEHGKPTAIKLDFVRSVDFFPCAYDNEMVTAAVFVESKKIGDYLYTRLEYHELSGREYTITNKAFRSEQIYQYDSDGGYSVNDRFQTEVSLSSVPDWAGLSGEPVRIGNVDKPLFVYIKVPVANNIDTSSPLGVSVYSRAVDVIENADRQYTKNYLGTEITAEKFGPNIFAASALIDRLTFGRIQRLDVVPESVKIAACAAAECLYQNEVRATREIMSENNDGYSVTYATGGTQKDATANAVAKIRSFLAPTGLLYRGFSKQYDFKDGDGP